MKKNKSVIIMIIGLILIVISAFILIGESGNDNPTTKNEEKKIKLEFESTKGDKIDISSYEEKRMTKNKEDYLFGKNIENRNRITYPLYFEEDGLFNSYYSKFYTSESGDMTIYSRITEYPSLLDAINYYEEDNFDKELYSSYNYAISKNKELINSKEFKCILSNATDKDNNFYQSIYFIIKLDNTYYFEITYTLSNGRFTEEDMSMIVNDIKIEDNAKYLLFDNDKKDGYLSCLKNNALKKIFINLDDSKYEEIETVENDLNKTNLEYKDNKEKVYLGTIYESENSVLEIIEVEYQFTNYSKNTRDYNGKEIVVLTNNKENIFYTEVDDDIYYLVKTKLSFEEISDLFDYRIE